MVRPLQVGIQLSARGQGDPSTSPYPSHRLMLDDSLAVEHLGLDSVWVADHFYFQQPAGLVVYPEAWTLLSAIAAKTERITVGTDVISATFRHPAMLAKMAGAVQDLCGGRFVLGIGAGNQPKEHAAFGLDFDHRIGRFKEYLPILHGLLNGETVTQTGRYFTLDGGSLRTFVPPVPLWIASGGPQMFDLTIRYGQGWNVAAGQDPVAVKQKYDEFATACAGAGRDVNEFDICKLSFIGIAENARSAEQMLHELAKRANLAPEDFARRTRVGTPETIAAYLRSISDIGINHHILAIAQSEQWPKYCDAFALVQSEVVPRLRESG
jgi:alkanesulfonate monooxygenase SsuD/methylene tetrahydromethanopterin reductase-like flavin-dependent oxidoreductase (luciferase family)